MSGRMSRGSVCKNKSHQMISFIKS